MRAEVLATRTLRGSDRTLVATPTVTAAVRVHTGCASAAGAELESTGGAGTSGSHLEDSVFFGDVMCGWIYSTDSGSAPTAYGQAVMSNVSLAVLEDLGFYTANWARAGALVWASGSGCGLSEQTCAEYVASEGEQRWYLGEAGQACTPDRCVSGGGCGERGAVLSAVGACLLRV